MEAKKSKETTKGTLVSSSTYISAKFKLILSGKLGAGVPVGGPASRGAGAEDGGEGGESKQELLNYSYCLECKACLVPSLENCSLSLACLPDSWVMVRVKVLLTVCQMRGKVGRTMHTA